MQFFSVKSDYFEGFFKIENMESTALTDIFCYVIYAFMVDDNISYIGFTLSTRYLYRMKEHLSGNGAKRLWASLNTLRDDNHKHTFKPLGYFTGTRSQALAVETYCMRYFQTIICENDMQECRSRHPGTSKKYPDIEIDRRVSYKLNEVASSKQEELIEMHGKKFIESLDANFALPHNEHEILERRIMEETKMTPYKYLEECAELICQDLYNHYNSLPSHNIVSQTTFTQDLNSILERVDVQDFPQTFTTIKTQLTTYHPDKKRMRLTNDIAKSVLNICLVSMSAEKETNVQSEMIDFPESKQKLLQQFMNLREFSTTHKLQKAPRVHVEEEKKWYHFLRYWKRDRAGSSRLSKMEHIDEINIIMKCVPWWSKFIAIKSEEITSSCIKLNEMLLKYTYVELRNKFKEDRAFREENYKVYDTLRSFVYHPECTIKKDMILKDLNEETIIQINEAREEMQKSKSRRGTVGKGGKGTIRAKLSEDLAKRTFSDSSSDTNVNDEADTVDDSDTVQYDTVKYDMVQGTVQDDTVQDEAVQNEAAVQCTVQCTVQDEAVQDAAVQDDMVQDDMVQGTVQDEAEQHSSLSDSDSDDDIPLTQRFKVQRTD